MNPNTDTTTRARLWAALGVSAVLFCATPAHAQLNGENLLGDMGVKSGTQPEHGLYVSTIYYRYFTDTIKDPGGNPLTLDSTGAAHQTIHAAMPLVLYVTPKKVLGANFGMMAVLPFASGSLEAPGRRYSAGASDNLGKGMWSYEVSAGGTLYLDSKRSLSLSTTAFWETHGSKEGDVHVDDVSISNVKVGQLVTVEGGIGKSFLHGAASIGAAYYAQWKVTQDQFDMSAGVTAPVGITAKHRVWGVGPEITIPIATKTKLISLVNVRYLWEQGARLKTEGHTFIITNTIPVGGVRIPARN